MCGGKRPTSGVNPKELFTLFLKTVSLTSLELKYTKLAGKKALGFSLFLIPTTKIIYVCLSFVLLSSGDPAQVLIFTPLWLS